MYEPSPAYSELVITLLHPVLMEAYAIHLTMFSLLQSFPSQEHHIYKRQMHFLTLLMDAKSLTGKEPLSLTPKGVPSRMMLWGRSEHVQVLSVLSSFLSYYVIVPLL
jgi:hypothetical protein